MTEKKPKNKFSSKTLDEDLYNSRMDNVKWAVQESSIQFNGIIKELSDNVHEQSVETAIRLYPYFQEALEDPNPEVRKMALEGLKFIGDTFPEI